MNPNSKAVKLFIVLLLSVISGCATITSSETQPLTVRTLASDGQPLEKADCSLKNESGVWQLSTPGIISVKRSAKDLMVECKKEGHPDGFVRAVSRAAGGMWGNIIFGGGIGAIIDHNKGTGYNYPNDLIVKMGSTITIDRRDEKNPEGNDQTNSGGINQPAKETVTEKPIELAEK